MTGFWEDLRERIIANQQAKLDDAAYNERLDNIGKATTALLEQCLPDGCGLLRGECPVGHL